jgi:hypothetical protein
MQSECHKWLVQKKKNRVPVCLQLWAYSASLSRAGNY